MSDRSAPRNETLTSTDCHSPEKSLRDEGIEFYRTMLRAGVKGARCRQVMGTVHGTEIFPAVCLDISHDTANDIVNFVKN